MLTAPVQVLPDLSIAIAGVVAVVTPAQAFALAEALIRTAARRALAEEAEQGVRDNHAPARRVQ